MSRLPLHSNTEENAEKLRAALKADPVAEYLWAIATFSVGDVPDRQHLKLVMSRNEAPWSRDDVENALELARHVRELCDG